MVQTPDEQEAQSVKYSDDTWSFQRLKSGMYAVYNREFGLMAVLPWSGVESLYLNRTRTKRKPQNQSTPAVNIDLGDLGL